MKMNPDKLSPWGTPFDISKKSDKPCGKLMQDFLLESHALITLMKVVGKLKNFRVSKMKLWLILSKAFEISMAMAYIGWLFLMAEEKVSVMLRINSDIFLSGIYAFWHLFKIFGRI